MTKLLASAIEKLRHLSESEQDAIARLVLEEMESERKWDEAIRKSPERLRKLADRAWAEHQRGESEPLDPEKL